MARRCVATASPASELAMDGNHGEFGPWVGFLPELERIARLRELRAVSVVILGPEHPLVASLCLAERDQEAADRALAELSALPALPRRRILALLATLREPERRR